MLSGIKALVIVLLVGKTAVSQCLVYLFTVKNAIWHRGVITHPEIHLCMDLLQVLLRVLSSSALVAQRSCLYKADY